MMIVHSAKPLFAWDCLEDSPSLQTIKDLLAALPDGKLLNSLRAARGKGRDDYPVSVLWGVVVLRVALRHITTEAILAELRRNEGLRRIIGIESESGVPNKWNMSRFEDVLGQEPHRTLLKEIFNGLIQRLGVTITDLGRDTAGDATDLSARRKPEEAAQEEIDEGLPQASGGRKEYKDDEGKVIKVVEWFGFKLHLLVDVKHEVALAYVITDTKAGDGETLPALLDQAKENLPQGRIKTLAYDKAADSEDVHKRLSGEGITPLVRMRNLWDTDPERMLPGHDGSSNVVYTEDGTIYCYDKVSEPPVRHPMAYIGYEPERETLKYRCPAKHEGWDCPMSTVCNAGKVVRQDSASRPRTGPAAVPVPAACHQEVRADVQGSDCGGARQRAVEDLLGRGRRQPDGVTSVRGPGGCGVGRARGVRDLVGFGTASRGDAGQIAAEPDRRGAASQGEGRAAGDGHLTKVGIATRSVSRSLCARTGP